MEIFRVSIWMVVAGILLACGWIVNWLWLRPMKLEKRLREQGFAGNSYRLFSGDLKETAAMHRQAKSKPMRFCHDIAPRINPFVHQTVMKYGKNSFTWVGPRPRVNIMDPEILKTVLSEINDFPRPKSNPLMKLLVDGLVGQEGPKWVKHRKIINPAFHLEQLKVMLPAFLQSCGEMISKWEKMISKEESSCCEIDVMPYLQTLAADVISRTAFGSNFEEGQRIFKLQKEMIQLFIQVVFQFYIPGWRFLPTKLNNRMKAIDKEVKDVLLGIINKRQRAMKAGEVTNSDLLGILLESNANEIQRHGNNKDVGMSIEDVIEECKLFYLAGQETTGTLLVWTMILLSSHPEWQEQARAEVLEVFGNNKPHFDGLSRLKVVTMILNEVLRLYPPVGNIERFVQNETRIGKLNLPSGVILSLPILLIHHDPQLWGEDAHEFKPERFSEGISKATKNQLSFFPFGSGPRICIGLNFAMNEAKIALSMILQHFSFILSSSYAHAPISILTIQPQYGAHIILHKL